MGLGDAYLAEELREIFQLIRETHLKVSEIGVQMATAAEQINELTTKVDNLAAVTADIHADFIAFRDAMQAERENLTPAGQAALDAANTSLDNATGALTDLDVEVGDADGSDNPPVPVP
jgi:outer membrane murein-binding lipoprotein Lpp